MGTITCGSGRFKCQWTSDVSFDGIRLEVLAGSGEVLLDVSVPDQGPTTVNTFSNEVPADLISEAMAVARQRR